MTKAFKFTIPGNPKGYITRTRQIVWLLKIPRNKVSEKYIKAWERARHYLDYIETIRYFALEAGFYKKYSTKPKEKLYLNVMIYFANQEHSDPENVRKAIQDALFSDDKKIAGSYDFDYDEDKPRVEVEIIAGYAKR